MGNNRNNRCLRFDRRIFQAFRHAGRCGTLVILAALLWSAALTGCAFTPTFENISQMPPEGKVLPIDGVWSTIFTFQKGYGYYSAPAAGTPVGAILLKDIKGTNDPLTYRCQYFYWSAQGKFQTFVDAVIHVTGPDAVDLVVPPNRARGTIERKFDFVATKLVDETALARACLLAKSIPHSGPESDTQIRERALKAIPSTDQKLLQEVARRCPDSATRLLAVKRVTGQAVLASVATTDKSSEVRQAALEKCSQATIFATISKCSDEKIADELISHLKDVNLLSHVALKHPSAKIRRKAIDRISDQAILGGIVEKTTHAEDAVKIVSELTNPAVLKAVGDKASTKHIRDLAIKQYKLYSNPKALMERADVALAKGLGEHKITLAVELSIEYPLVATANQIALLKKYHNSTSGPIDAELASFKLAIKYYNCILKLTPESPKAMVKKALAMACWDRQGNTTMVFVSTSPSPMAYADLDDSVLALATRAVNLSSKSPEILGYRGWIRLIAYRLRKQKAAELRTNPPSARMLDLAINDLSAAIDARKDLTQFLCQRAMGYFLEKNRAKARADVETAQKMGGKPQPQSWLVQWVNEKD